MRCGLYQCMCGRNKREHQQLSHEWCISGDLVIKMGVLDMKKLIISGLIAMFCASAGATTMCATDDTLAIVLAPVINGTDHSSNSDLFEWSATFSYGTLWGIATCVDTSGTVNTAVEELRDSNGEIATGGERTGRYCWCQLAHPARSRWVFRHSYSSAGECRSLCTNGCGSNIQNFSASRTGLFGAVAN